MTDRLSPRDILDHLIGFPTVSRDTNLPLIDWVEEYLTGHGISCHRHIKPDEPIKAGLFAHVGPEVDGGVVLSGHTDVVPVDGQPWTVEPFAVTETDGKLFGRGTTDMKGFDALAIWAMVEAHHRGVSRPLQIALSYDEEIGCTGAPPLIDAMQGVVPRADTVIVGEPTMLKAVTGHKGGTTFWVHVHGFEVHSSIMHTGVNAIMYGAKLIEWANRLNAESAAATAGPIAAQFDPPYTNVHVGQIKGGTAHNITAKDCEFGLGFRVVPGETLAQWEDKLRAAVAEIEAEMQAVRPETWIEVKPAFALPPFKPEDGGQAETLVRQLTGDNGTQYVSYGTEASHFQSAGYSVVVCGPGDIAVAHQPDEYITVAQFEAGQDFMRRLLDSLSG
ncbi:acetylornithine deacetylase [Marivita hallyeonensis]|uniref:Acetylornithine deacetylase n=1 Tax=Marivita hallyeonensis TaxID=996342 RepID=A0A1M5RQ61_9RHOB|nr:acetylornithine deacetylase [Marivita hallyeonensis]SHH28435.1 acetylornithine deacetylase [Marivita hallyeonensis]